jgi:NAD dependent epimerase/dehydratase family enzyme
MRILICGADGMVGQALSSALTEAGHQIVRGFAIRVWMATERSISVCSAVLPTGKLWCVTAMW